jgi:EpsG family
MIIYLAIFFVLLCAVVAGFRPPSSLMNRGLYFLSTALMIGCAGLRAESVGRDYAMYRIYFDASPDTVGPGFLGQWTNTMPFVDIAYVYFNSLVRMAGIPFEGLIFLIALIVVTLYAVFFWKHSRFGAIALMVYFSHAFLNREMVQIRAGIACVIALWAFHFWACDRKRWGSVLMLLAVMTHLAVIAAVIPLVFFHFKWAVKPRYVLLTVLTAIVIGYNLSSSSSLFSMVERLALFQDSVYSTSVGIFSNIVTIKQFTILGLSCWLLKSGEGALCPPVVKLCVISYWIATLWIIAFSQFSILGQRGASFLWIGEPLIISEMVARFYRGVQLRRYRRFAAITVVCFALSTLVLDLNKKEVFNDYTTIFQQ